MLVYLNKVIQGNTMKEQLYHYVWGNDKTAVGRWRLKHFKGRKCRIIARGGLNSVGVKFIDTGELLNCSRNALRKVLEISKWERTQE